MTLITDCICVHAKLIMFIFLFIVIDVCNKQHTLDKDIATAIQKALCADPDLRDECAGWHVICGKSFASAITYQTENVLFFDLLEGCNKSFLIFKTQ